MTKKGHKEWEKFHSELAKRTSANVSMRLLVIVFLFQLFLHSFVNYIELKGCMPVYYSVLLDIKYFVLP